MDDFKKNIYEHIKVIVCFYMICMCIDGRLYIFAREFRYGLKITQLMYSHPTIFVACCILLIMLLIVVKDQTVLYIEEQSIWRSNSCCSYLLFCFLQKEKDKSQTLLMLGPLGRAIAWDQIEYYFFSSIGVHLGTWQILMKRMGIENAFTRLELLGDQKTTASIIDWRALYSFEETESVGDHADNRRFGPADSYSTAIQALKEKVEDYTNTTLAGRERMIFEREFPMKMQTHF
ncbi:MAG: hypothetical protein HDQ96_13910 [Lachnospiraceae bacterium]|nr:hypothetical protein [Lachnospiraceae bacterium]